MIVDLEILNSYLEKGWVVKNDHPTLPISIWNYSRACQFERNWDDYTIMCRGLVLDSSGKVIAKSFNKFFNVEELTPEQIPNQPFDVFEKLDGSLGILFNYEGEWILSTKGSFKSDQSIRANEILKKYKYQRLNPRFTYLFEIIYPENRIVCHYDYEDLILIGVIDNLNGLEVDVHSDAISDNGNLRIRNMILNLGFKLVKNYDGIKDYNTLKSLISKDREGYVIRFQNGFRMKIKGEDYVYLHSILTNFSNINIWEYLKDDKDFSGLLERTPDEFDLWVKNTRDELMTQYNLFDKLYQNTFDKIKILSSTKKEFAELAMKYKHPSILFSMYDGKDYSGYIWKLLRPVYSKPFWKKEES